MAQVLDPSLERQARDALERHAWTDAYDLLSAADASGQLSPDELELLGQASWWTGRLPAAIDARERAYAGYTAAGDKMGAVRTAIYLGRDHLLRNSQPIAHAWLNRAQRGLEGLEEGAGHGWLAVTRAVEASLSGRLEEAEAESDRAAAIAEAIGDRDLAAQAMSSKGMSEILNGRLEQGLALIDEATAVAVAGGIEPLTAGAISCATISACTSLGDWPRAVQWTEAQDRWCQRERINGFPGMCRLHRAETKRLRGDWLEAEAEARRASDELQGFIPAAIGVALYEIGLIRLRRGDLEAAEDALLRAHQYGRDPQPALSLLRLAQGRIPEAVASIRRALDEPGSTAWGLPPGTDLGRMALLPARVEIALAAGDAATARAAADELAGLTERFSTAATRAQAACVQGMVLVAEGRPAEATRIVRESIQLWAEIDAPWEAARARLVLGSAYEALGDVDGAELELGSARTAFESLGAELDRRRVEEALARLRPDSTAAPTGGAGRSAVRTFVFTDIVDSTRFAELLGDESWEQLIRWHDEMLRSVVAEHGGEVVKRTGDGFFLAFESTAQALECAIAIQRRLAQQRRAQGFAPAVRIGVHRGRASRASSDYIGSGVNQAARIGGVAGGDEILVSAATLGSAGRAFTETGRRTVELKGIGGPVEVASIGW